MHVIITLKLMGNVLQLNELVPHDENTIKGANGANLKSFPNVTFDTWHSCDCSFFNFCIFHTQFRNVLNIFLKNDILVNIMYPRIK